MIESEPLDGFNANRMPQSAYAFTTKQYLSDVKGWARTSEDVRAGQPLQARYRNTSVTFDPDYYV